jgi:hypothetical protein
MLQPDGQTVGPQHIRSRVLDGDRGDRWPVRAKPLSVRQQLLVRETVDRLRQLGWCNADNLSRYDEHERRVVLHNTAVHLYKL